MGPKKTDTKRHRPGVDRRGALLRLGLGAGVAACAPACRPAWVPPEKDETGRALHKPYVPGAEDFATHEERWIATTCGQCPAGCGVRVRVVEGRAVRIEGHPKNPVNRGGIGVRGLSGLEALYDPDRLRGPLARRGGQLVPISWNEALTALGEALRATRARGPAELLVLSGQDGGFVHELLERFAHVFGTPNLVDGSPAHGAPITQAMAAALGTRQLPSYSWDRVGAIFTLEAGLFEDSCRSIYFARVAASLRRDAGRRARLIHAGPAFDLAAYNADQWLRVRPGTSGALALGVCRELLARGHYDADFAGRARGFAEFRALAERYTPARVTELCGVDGGDVARLAATLWEQRPAVVVVDERSVAFSNGFDTAGAALALNALLGAVENPAGGLRVPESPPYAPWPEPELDDVARRGLATPRLDGAGRGAFASARSVLDHLPDALASTPPAVALLYHANPAYARPQPRAFAQALAKVPLVVSFSPYRDETVDEVAHLVLPDHTYLERFEDATPAAGLAQVVAGVRRPVITPLHDTRPTGDVLLDLARRVGGSVAQAFPWPTFRAALEERLVGLHAASRGSITATSPEKFLDRLYQEGYWAEVEATPAYEREFSFPTGWSPPSFAGDAGYPLALLAYRPLGHAEGGGANQPWLRTLRARPGLADWTLAASVAPSDVPAGASDGELVRVESPFGAVELPLHVDPRLQPGTVAIPTGGGHRAFGRWAKGFGVNVMELLPPTPAHDTGASMLCSTRVRVVRARRA